MKVDTSHLEDHQVKLTVELDSSYLDSAKQKAARRLARQIKIPGFRPGKAPFPVVLRHVGEASILEEAIEILVQDIYPEIISTAGIEPYGPGSLDKIISTEPPIFEFVVPLKATVVLGDYTSVRESYEHEGIKDEEIEEVVENLREQHAIIELVERNAQVGDLVNIQINARSTGETESDPIIKDRPLNVLVQDEDSENENEWPFPGFSKMLLGLKSGDIKQFTYKFSDNSPYEMLKSVEADLNIEVKEVRSRTLPVENDEFAQEVGEFTTLAELRKTIRENLENRSLEAYNAEYDEKILGKLVETSTINYPPQMLEREIDDIIHNLNDRLEQQGLSMDLYLKSRDINAEELREETKPVAETRLKKSLVLLEAAEAEKIQIEPQELQAETEKTLGEASRVLPEKEYRKLVKGDVASNLVGNIMMEMLIEKTRQRLREIAKGEAEIVASQDRDEGTLPDVEQTEEVETSARDLPDEAEVQTEKVEE